MSSIFDIASKKCSKEILLVLKPGEYKKTRKRKRKSLTFSKQVGLGPRLKAYRKILDVLHSAYQESEEYSCLIPGCTKCCYRVPIIHTRTEYTYLKKAIELNNYARSLGDSTGPAAFRVWAKFCESAGLNPFSPYDHPAAMWDWTEFKIRCPLYSESYGKCLIEDTKPVACRFGQNHAPCRQAINTTSWDPQEIASLSVDERLRLSDLFDREVELQLTPPGEGVIWPRSIDNWLLPADKEMFPDKPKFSRTPIFTLFKFK